MKDLLTVSKMDSPYRKRYCLICLYCLYLNCNLLELNIPESQVLIEFFQSFNLSQVVTKPTRSTDKSKSLLDVILVSNTNQVLESDVLISSISDHDLVYIKLRLKREKSTHFHLQIS